jgi:hypothetical protein
VREVLAGLLLDCELPFFDIMFLLWCEFLIPYEIRYLHGNNRIGTFRDK